MVKTKQFEEGLTHLITQLLLNAPKSREVISDVAKNTTEFRPHISGMFRISCEDIVQTRYSEKAEQALADYLVESLDKDYSDYIWNEYPELTEETFAAIYKVAVSLDSKGYGVVSEFTPELLDTIDLTSVKKEITDRLEHLMAVNIPSGLNKFELAHLVMDKGTLFVLNTEFMEMHASYLRSSIIPKEIGFALQIPYKTLDSGDLELVVAKGEELLNHCLLGIAEKNIEIEKENKEKEQLKEFAKEDTLIAECLDLLEILKSPVFDFLNSDENQAANVSNLLDSYVQEALEIAKKE